MYYGLDVHKEEIQVCKLMSENTDSREELRFKNNDENLIAFANSLTEKDQVVFEASFNSWHVHAALKMNSKARIVVANAHKVGLIAQARIKSDKIDAFILAKLLRANFVPEVQLPSEYSWELRQLSYHRRQLAKQVTSSKNIIRSILNKKLIRCPYSTPFTLKGKAWLEKLPLSPSESLIMTNSLASLNHTEKMIDLVDQEIIVIAKKDKQIQLLMSIPGVDFVCALGIVAAIDDIERFDAPEKLASYFGLVPTLSQSGDKCYHGRITKMGSKNARRLLTEAAQALVLTSAPLAAIYYRVKAKKGHNKAIIALARKIVMLIWQMLKKGEPYRYAPSARTREKLRRLNPSTPAMDRTVASKLPIAEIYREFNLPELALPSTGEKRALANSKRTVTKHAKREEEKIK